MLNDYQVIFAVNAIERLETIGTKASLARSEKIRYYLNNSERLCGAWGCIQELADASDKSTKKAVASQGKIDGYMTYEENGKRKRVAVEVKSNGGRISALRRKGAPRFVVYSLDFKNSNGEAHLPAMIIPTETFLAVLDKYGLTKSTNGKNPEEAIQHTKKALRLWLEDYWMPYDANAVYIPEDFEEIEI